MNKVAKLQQPIESVKKSLLSFLSFLDVQLKNILSRNLWDISDKIQTQPAGVSREGYLTNRDIKHIKQISSSRALHCVTARVDQRVFLEWLIVINN